MVERTQTGGWMPSLYEPIRTVGRKVADWFAPRSDASTTTDAYVITMELPGVDPENVEIAVQDAALVVTGEKQSEHEETTKNYFFSEREYGMFQRAFRITEGFSTPDLINARTLLAELAEESRVYGRIP